MKRFMIIFISIMFVLSGCGRSEKAPQDNDAAPQGETSIKEDEEYTITVDAVGLSFVIPTGWRRYLGGNIFSLAESSSVIDYNLHYYFLTNAQAEQLNEKLDAAVDADEMYAIVDAQAKEYIEIAQFVVFEDYERDEKEVQDVFGRYEKGFEAPRVGDTRYYSLYNENYDISRLSDDEKQLFENILKDLPILNASMKTFEKSIEKVTLSFQSENMEGVNADESIFGAYDLTMINFWATYCDPCIEEMPDIEKLYNEMKEKNVNIIGVVTDVYDTGTKDLAKEIIGETGVTYENIIPDEHLTEYMQTAVYAVPTTVFVDKDGNVIGESVIGQRNRTSYKKEIEKRMSVE